MAFENKEHKQRLLNIQVAKDIYSNISTLMSEHSIKTSLAGSDSDNYFYITDNVGGNDNYNMPYLLHGNGDAWDEANAYLYYLSVNKHVMSRSTDELRRKASRLLSYMLFCEKENIDWLDFSGKRPSQRPTYKYFQHLFNNLGLKPRVGNIYTSDVYHFYKYVSEYWKEHGIDIKRVDSTETIRIYFQHSTGLSSKKVTKRELSRKTYRSTSDSIGYVRDDGELLRPLTVEQWVELKSIINGDNWSNFERLIILIAATTGARKQSVLTLKVKHINKMLLNEPNGDGFYKLFIGSGTGIDAKNDKHQALYFHPNLAKELKQYIDSPKAKELRDKFQYNYRKKHPSLPEIADDELYVFISEQGNCYYISKNDPRYPVVKSRPLGQVTENLKKKILKSASETFPKDFYFHWLRATYAFLLWSSLQEMVKKGEIDQSIVISIIQNRMSHENRETTENYLKLFDNYDIRLDMQKAFEDVLLSYFF